MSLLAPSLQGQPQEAVPGLKVIAPVRAASSVWLLLVGSFCSFSFYWDIVVLHCCVSLYYSMEFPVLYSMFSLVIYFIHISVYMSIPISQFIPLSPLFLPWCPYVCSLHLCLYFCLVNRFICTIFLDSTYTR